jgi:peptidyl-tRNA hydrolase
MADDEVVQYLIIRADLKLLAGKLAAQAGHAVPLAMRAVERSGDERTRRHLERWESGSYTKIALATEGAEALATLCDDLSRHQVIHARVVDEGRTVIEPDTVTAVGLQPLPKTEARPFVGKLKLL